MRPRPIRPHAGQPARGRSPGLLRGDGDPDPLGPGARRRDTTAVRDAAPHSLARRPGPGAQLDNAAAGAIARELTVQGISEAWAHELVVTAAAHLTPFTPDGTCAPACAR